jgi:hypothetical protein
MLLIFLIIFYIFLKYVELNGVGLGAVHVIAAIILLITLWKSKNKSRFLHLQFGRQSAGLYLLLFLLFICSQYFLYQGGLSNPQMSKNLVLIYITAMLVFVSTYYALQLKPIEYQKIYDYFIVMSVVSSAFLLIQTYLSIGVYPQDWFISLGLADSGDKLDQGFYLTQIRGVGIGRSITDFASHNFLAVFAALAGFFKYEGKKKALYAFAASLIIIAVMRNNSQGAILGFASAFFIFGLRKLKLPLQVGGIALALWLLLPRIYVFLIDASSFGQNYYGSSAVARLYIWSKAVSMFVSSPIYGVGIGNQVSTMVNIDPYYYVNYSYGAITLHSWAFDILAFGGIIGSVLFCMFLIKTYQASIADIKDRTLFSQDMVLPYTLVSYIVFGLFTNVHYMAYDFYVISAMIVWKNIQSSRSMPFNEIAVNL